MRVLTTDLTLTTPRGRDRFGLRTDPDGLGRFAERIAALLGTGRFLAARSTRTGTACAGICPYVASAQMRTCSTSTSPAITTAALAGWYQRR